MNTTKISKVTNHIINRRIFILQGIHITITIAFTTKFYYLQIKNNKKYQTLSDNNRRKVVLIAPSRGKILDRNDEELATTKRVYKVLCEPKYVDNIDQLIFELIKITKVPISKNLVYKIKNTSSIVTIYNEISWQNLINIEFNIAKLSGIYIVPFYKRYYPFANICSHIVGYIKNYNQNSDFKKKLGVCGIEYSYDTKLKGNAEILEQEIDAKGRFIKHLSRTSGQAGENIKLTIDIHLQTIAAKLLENNNGAITIIEIESGNVLVLYSSPSYDNNIFINGISNLEWKNVNDNINSPLINRNISLQTEPASTFKIITALAALENNIINQESKITCSGKQKIGDTTFRCWKHQGHGTLNLSKAIAMSCNAYFYTIGQKISIDSLVSMASRFGFGKISNIQLLGESSGIIPDKAWRTKKVHNKWQLGDTINVAIGHGYLLVTPIQLAVFAARIASGRKIVPNLDLSTNNMTFPELDVETSHLKFIRQSLFNVVNSPIGTASHHIQKRNISTLMQMSGKTGIAQVISSKSDNIDLLQKEKKNKDHGLFIGYAPSYNPKYAISVFMEHVGNYPSAKAVIIAQQIFNYIKKIDL